MRTVGANLIDFRVREGRYTRKTVLPMAQTTSTPPPAPPPQQQQQQQQQNRSIGLSSRPQNASEGPLSLLQHASPSRLLYSLMIVENLLDRDLDDGLEDAESDIAAARQALAEEAEEAERNRGIAGRGGVDRGSPGSAERPGEGGGAWSGGGGAGPGGGGSDGEWEVFPPAFGAANGGFGAGGVGVGGGGGVKVVRRTWRDRFVSNGGIDTLVELLLTRDWDATRGGGGGGEEGRGGEEVGAGESTVGISLACLALLLVLIERFIEEEFMPEPRQLARLVRFSIAWCFISTRELAGF